MKRVTTLADLATLAGVSIGTVSKALSGSGYLAAATQQRIRQLAEEHGFQINRTAQRLKRGRTDAIAVVLPLGHETAQTFSDPFFIAMIGHLADELSRRGNDLLLSKVVPDGPGWLAAIARSGRVDGIIVIGQSDQEDELARVAATYPAMMVWGQHDERNAYCSVGSDNHAGGRLAAQRLIAAGRRRLAFVGTTDTGEIAARHRGFVAACTEAGVADVQLVEAHMTSKAAYQAIAAALDAGLNVDGIAAASDVIAISVIRALAERGHRVPETVAVVGYDDVGLAAFTNPPLTTVRQDLTYAARLLVDLLFRRMAGGETASVVMAPTLVARTSA